MSSHGWHFPVTEKRRDDREGSYDCGDTKGREYLDFYFSPKNLQKPRPVDFILKSDKREGCAPKQTI